MAELSTLLASLEGSPWPDLAAILVFAVLWLGYEPLMRQVSRRRGSLNRDMDTVRVGWMVRAVSRTETRLLDANLMGHAINSASFFASANLILIAAVAGAVFGGDAAVRRVASISVLAPVPAWVLQIKLALILTTLARGLLDFIWSIRQMNYWLAAIGSAPEDMTPSLQRRWADALAGLMNPALASFGAGVRGYYFALAAATWLLGPAPFAAGALAAVTLLAWRQSRSKAAHAIRTMRALVEDPDAAPP